MPPNLNNERVYSNIYTDDIAVKPIKMNHLRSLLGTQAKDEAKKATKSKINSKAATSNATKGSNLGSNQLRPLHCVAQQYAWGRLGSSSTVALMKDAQVSKENEEMFEIDEDKPYAELWLGTHPNGMSMVTVQDEETNGNKKLPLIDYIRQDTTMHCGNEQENDISYLLKVLSVRKVLSIQAHPDKKTAERLHAERPKIYKDPNHKPEMAIAMSEKVRAMIGFRPLAEIAKHLDEYPEFQDVLGPILSQEIKKTDTAAAAAKSLLRQMFKEYLEKPTDVIEKNIDAMVDRLRKLKHHDDLQKLILQLEQQFPGDVGIFAPLIFNIAELEYGQGLFIGANEPHAYISGEILECMACSDNVVRCGCTPKLKDVPTLVNMLTFENSEPDIQNGQKIDECTTRYQPPVEDFCVEVIYVPGGAKYELSAVNSASVFLTLEGDAQLVQDDRSMAVSFGTAAFASANTTCTVEAGPYGVRLTRAFTNVFHK